MQLGNAIILAGILLVKMQKDDNLACVMECKCTSEKHKKYK